MIPEYFSASRQDVLIGLVNLFVILLRVILRGLGIPVESLYCDISYCVYVSVCLSILSLSHMGILSILLFVF
jgi:hypothetical protein